MDYGALAQAGIQGAGEIAAADQKGKSAELLRAIAARFAALRNPALERARYDPLSSDEAGVRSDPAMQAAQAQALARLQQTADEGGYTLEQKAVQNQIQGGLARHESAGRNAIRNNMAARGVGGSGAELAMQLAGNQNSAERASEEGMSAAGQAQKAALNAIMGRGELAGRMRGQDFDERSKAARAGDMMKQYNSGAQQRADAYNRGIPQQDWENSLRSLGAQSGADSALAGMHNNNAADIRTAGAGYGYAARAGINGQSGGSKRNPYADDVSAPPLVNADDPEDDWNKWNG